MCVCDPTHHPRPRKNFVWEKEGRVSELPELHDGCACITCFSHVFTFFNTSSPRTCRKFLRNKVLWVWTRGRVWRCPGGVKSHWSLTQFYSVDFLQLKISVKKCVFIKHKIKVFVSCSWRCPGTFALSAAHLAASLSFLCSYGCNALGKSRALEGRGAMSAQKALQGSETVMRELLGGMREKSVSPMRGHWFASRQINDILTKIKQKKIELVARPLTCKVAEGQLGNFQEAWPLVEGVAH